MERDKSTSDQARDTSNSYVPSPRTNTSRFHRQKYYSAIKSGMGQLNPSTMRQSFLQPPRPEEALPPMLALPGVDIKGETKTSSIMVIFSCWNTMVGSAIVFLPADFQQCGIVLGLIISTTSFLLSYYTCALIIETAHNDADYVFTLKKYYGKNGLMVGVLAPTILIWGALCAYFGVICQNLYPILYYIIHDGFKVTSLEYLGTDPSPFLHAGTFSLFWVTFVMFAILVTLSSKRDLSLFMKIGSIGAFCVSMLILFVIYEGIRSLTDTKYTFTTMVKDNETATKNAKADPVTLFLFNTAVGGFGQLVGVFSAGYFIHQCSLPIIQNAAKPEQNGRNVFIGYLMVYLTYCIVGVLGYIGFTGERHYEQLQQTKGMIPGNFLLIFNYDEIPAIIVRSLLFIQLTCAYPLVNHFQRCLLVSLLYEEGTKVEELPQSKFLMLNVGINIPPLLINIFIPQQVGMVLGLLSSISGFLMIYVVPVMAYIKMRKLQIEFPMLAAAVRENELILFDPDQNNVTSDQLPSKIAEVDEEYTDRENDARVAKYKEYEEQVDIHLSPSMSKSPKLIISNRFMRRQKYGLNIQKNSDSKSPVFGKDEQVRVDINPGSEPTSRFASDITQQTNHAKRASERERLVQIQNKESDAAMSERDVPLNSLSEGANERLRKAQEMSTFKKIRALHMCIPLYGFAVLIICLMNSYESFKKLFSG